MRCRSPGVSSPSFLRRGYLASAIGAGASGDDILQGDDGKTDTDHARDDDRLDGGTDGDTVRGGGGSDTIMDDASEVDENFAYWADWVDAV